jgi:hypothetical protein
VRGAGLRFEANAPAYGASMPAQAAAV